MTSCWKCWELWDCGKSALRAGGLGLSTRGRSFASAQIGRSQPVTLGDPFSEWLLLYGGILVEGVVVVPRLAGSADPQVQTRALGVAAGFARKRAVSHGRIPSPDERALPWKGWDVSELDRIMLLRQNTTGQNVLVPLRSQ